MAKKSKAMETVNRTAKSILDLLPFNGQKLKLSFWALAASLFQFFPGVDLIGIVQAILANPTRSSVIAILVAAIHKRLKDLYPDYNV